MRRFSLLLPISTLIVSTLLVGCDGTSVDSKPTNKEPTPKSTSWRIDTSRGINNIFECLEDEKITLVSAHRGGAYSGYPENAVETMQYVMDKTPAIMEIDVATSSDGVLYLMHDDTLDRTTNGTGSASSLAWNEIENLRLQDASGDSTTFHPPKLADALRFAKDRTILQIDFKQSTRYEDVVDEVKHARATNSVVYIAYSMASAKKLHHLHPGAMISLSINSQTDLNRAISSGIPENRLLGFTGTEDPRPRLFNLLNGRDVEVIFGTLGGYKSIDNEIARSGDSNRYSTMAKLGIDILATDRPIEASVALSQASVGPVAGKCGLERI